jgi:hypothetical protein
LSTPTYSNPTFAEHTGEAAGKAAAAVDGGRDMIARRIHSAASTLHSRANWLPRRYKVARAAHATANAMESAADYLRDQDVRAMVSDVRQVARRHPGAALLTAAAVGFLIARSLRRR